MSDYGTFAAAPAGGGEPPEADAASDAGDAPTEDVVIDGGLRFQAYKGPRTVTTTQLTWMLFFCVSGGAYGLEDAVRAGGAGWTLALLLVIPLFWSVPVGLTTAELSAAMPVQGGYVVWVSRAFGRLGGFAMGYIKFFSNTFDLALYPVLFVSYFKLLVGRELHASVIYLMRVVLSLLVGYLNVLGVEVVGALSVLLGFATLAPFVVLSVWGAAAGDVSPSQWVDFESPRSIDWAVLLSTTLWANSGWDAAGTVAGAVREPQRTYPRGVLAAVVLVIAANIIPVGVAVCVDTQYGSWDTENSFWATLGGTIGGAGLKWSVLVSALLSNLGLFTVLLAANAWALYAMGVPGLLHFEPLRRMHASYNTPWISISINVVLVAIIAMLPFDSLVQVDVGLNVISLMLEVAAVIYLRVREPEMRRPFRIPLGSLGLALALTPGMALAVFILTTLQPLEHIIVAGVLASCALAYWLVRRRELADARAKAAEDDRTRLLGDVAAKTPQLPNGH